MASDYWFSQMTMFLCFLNVSVLCSLFHDPKPVSHAVLQNEIRVLVLPSLVCDITTLPVTLLRIKVELQGKLYILC